jgi:hypothetical protein
MVLVSVYNRVSDLIVLVVDAVSGSGRLVCKKFASACQTVFGSCDQCRHGITGHSIL